MTQYSIDQVQENPERVIRAAEREKAVEITRQGKQVAILLSVEEYSRLIGEKQSQSGFGTALRKFRQELIEEGLEINPDEVFKDVRDRSPGREVVL
jgi:cellobiose PTS system EIIB component